ncbi:MAG: arsenic metallochaperone ArsD family protein [Rothia sp. (in: high G+C Gram-positive bacteria)]|nr:arsenic metallochaperone ArsD family protein [Rothia sp. (in: high G+C Gram-positive bacteria)]
MAKAKDSIGSTPLEVFVPAAGVNPADPQDAARNRFFDEAQALLDEGLDIAVYSTDSYPSAFTDCEPVADQIAINGTEVLPILLVEGQVKVSFGYPTAEQLRRFSHFGELKQPKVSAAATACGTGGADVPTLPAAEPAGFAAVLAGVAERPVGGPDIGNRVNLMGGDFGDGIPTDGSSVAVKSGGGCCGGACGCGSGK